MAVERYCFDDPVGLYGYESQERLAKGVIRASVRYADAIIATESIDEFQYTELSMAPPEEVHLGTIVESRDAHFGYALAVSLGETAVIGAYCLVERDGEPRIKDQPKALEIARSETYGSNQDYKDEVKKLMLNFDKTELDTIMRILGKVTVSIEIANELGTFDRAAFKELGVAAQRKKEDEIREDKATLRKLSAVEPFTFYAVHNNGRNMPDNLVLPDNSESDSIEHISEWTEFIDAANGLVERECDADQGVSHVNLQHEIDTKMYCVTLIANHGRLSGAQLLRLEQTDAWQSQYFDINSDKDEDGAGLNMVSQMWNRTAVVACLHDGEIIDNETYEEYRRLAETSLKKVFKQPLKLVRPQDIEKRPAA